MAKQNWASVMQAFNSQGEAAVRALLSRGYYPEDMAEAAKAWLSGMDQLPCRVRARWQLRLTLLCATCAVVSVFLAAT